MTLDEVLSKLRASRGLLDEYAVERIGVFGSVARGEARPDSDVDLGVHFKAGRTPGLKFFELQRRLEALVGRRVDLMVVDGLREPIRSGVLRDLAYA
jgi:predicted nucleotidyltransferase